MPQFISVQISPGAPWGEVLFLITAVLSVLSARKGRLVLAGVLAAVATAIRLEGVFLLLPLLLEIVADSRKRVKKDEPGFDPAYLIAALPLLTFLLYDGALRFILSLPGDPLRLNERTAQTEFSGYHLSAADRYAIFLYPVLILVALFARRWPRLNTVLALAVPALLVGMSYRFVSVHWVH